MEKTTSEIPPSKKESAKSMDKVSSELSGDVNATILTMTKNIPTSNGIYQCLITSLIDFKNKFSISSVF